jgi:hypothetical protein
MPDKPAEAMVEQTSERASTAARNLQGAANANNSLEGYASVNGLNEHDEIARLAEEIYHERIRTGADGTAEDDWFRAEAEVRRRR